MLETGDAAVVLPLRLSVAMLELEIPSADQSYLPALQFAVNRAG
jgi:hypothetical protein